MVRKTNLSVAADSGQIIEPTGSDGEQIEQGNGSADNGAIAGSGESGHIDPATLSGTSTDDVARNDDGTVKLKLNGEPARKRGRKSGSTNGTRSAGSASNSQNLKTAIDQLSNMIGFVHIGIANVAKCPEMLLAPQECQALAMATANVMEQFDIRPDPKVTAIVGLLTTAGTIYLPRTYLIQKRRAEERTNKKRNKPPTNEQQFTDIPVNGTGNGIDPSAFDLGG